ncbi:hypothetical protein [Cryobacterium zhongshanensis]|uniref:Uncharacterized protein n=1 Tax=Cryobacterium zhongshanensis TaxID=2928153 RepID=A0AA41UII8_9MICO|nr:hypothetical protein [Cryobacterium zhongshanensis]MCI4659574.1 hypothetical protein [Cryobacterium zhongshanensis]
MSTYDGMSEVAITSEELLNRHIALALIKSAEQQRVANILAAERLMIEYPETRDRIEAADIQAALEDRTPLSPRDFVTRVMDAGDAGGAGDESWTVDDRIADGYESTRALTLDGDIAAEDAFPEEPDEFDDVVIRSANTRLAVTRHAAEALILKLGPLADSDSDPFHRSPIALQSGRTYWVTYIDAHNLKNRLTEVLARRDEKLRITNHAAWAKAAAEVAEARLQSAIHLPPLFTPDPAYEDVPWTGSPSAR